MSNHSHVSQHATKDRRCIRFFLAALMLLCFTLGLAGCIAEEQEERPPFTVAVGEPSKITVSSVPGLSLIIEEKEYAGPDVTVSYALQNETELIYWYGPMSMWMEVFQDGEWHRLALRTDIDTAATADAIGIRPNAGTETPQFSKTVFHEYGDIVPAGTYRLVIGVSTDENPSVKEYLAAEFDVIEWPSQTPSPDQAELAKDFWKIETEYFDHQELLQSIVQAFWDNAEISSVVPASAPESAKLWTADGETEAFARDYPQLYSDVCSLSDAGFKWCYFSRYEEQENVIDCFISSDIYQKGYWTSFSFYFCTDTLPEIPQTDYYAQLSENCWLIARKLPTA